jgi:hypothetical protein
MREDPHKATQRRDFRRIQMRRCVGKALSVDYDGEALKERGRQKATRGKRKNERGLEKRGD